MARRALAAIGLLCVMLGTITLASPSQRAGSQENAERASTKAAVERAEAAAEMSEQAATRGDRAARRADSLTSAMQVFVGVLALMLAVAGLFGFSELRRLRAARREAEKQVAVIQGMVDGLKKSWIRFVQAVLARLDPPDSYIDGTRPESEQAEDFLSADRVAVVADALGLANHGNETVEILMRLGRHWKSQGLYSRALQRFQRSAELAGELNPESAERKRALNFAALTLIEWAEQMVGRSTESSPEAIEDASRERSAALLRQAEEVLTPLLGEGAEVSVETLFIEGKLRWAQRRLDEALSVYSVVIERARASADREERADGLRAVYNSACALCDRRQVGDLYRAMTLLESLPRSEGWGRWARMDPDLEPLRSDSSLGERFGLFTGES